MDIKKLKVEKKESEISETSQDSSEELNAIGVIENQFKSTSLMITLISLSVYSILNLISDISQYVSFYLTYGEFNIEKSQLIAFLINLCFLLLIISILLFKSSFSSKRFSQISTIFVGIGLGIILTILNNKIEFQLNKSEFPFLIFIFYIPLILLFLIKMNDFFEETWFFNISIFYLSFLLTLIILNIKNFKTLTLFIKENSLIFVENIFFIIFLYLFYFIIENREKINNYFQKLRDKEKEKKLLIINFKK